MTLYVNKREVTGLLVDKKQVTNVILDIKKYSEFIPHCTKIILIDELSGGDFFVADTTVKLLGIEYTYRTKTQIVERSYGTEIISISGKTNIFDSLVSKWKIVEHGLYTDIFHEVNIEINPFLYLTAKKMLDDFANQTFKAFAERLEKVDLSLEQI